MAEPGYVWLAQSAAELVVKTAGGAPSPVGAVDCDVLVVGSGYGGAVAAARLAGTTATGPGQAPSDARIWLVERGLEHVPGDFPSRFAELPGQVRIAMQDGAAARGIDTGLFDLRLGPDVSALLASGLGGGSLINAGVMKRPPAAVFDSGWPAAITQGALEAAYGAALAMLQPAAVPPAQACAKLATLDCLAKAGGQPPPERCPVTVNWANAPAPTPAGVALASCTLCGDCVTGCNQGAKGSLDTNYLAAARARGVEMFCGVSVSFIERAADDSHWVVRWHHTDRACRAADGQPFALRARRVVLAAGTLGSTEILLRSRAHGLVLSPQLGEGFSTNGDSLVAGARHPVPVHDVADPESDPADSGARRVGANITGLLAVPADPQGPAFVVEEASVPAALREVFGEVVAMLSWGAGEREGYLVSEDAIERLSLFALMGDDGAAGRLRLPAAAAGATPAVEAGLRIDWLGAAQLPLYTRMHSWVASSLYPVPAIGTGLLGTGLTVHPLGGCRMGEQFDQAVVDDCGRVFAEGVFTHPGLAVLDGSIVPRALGINPALTIAALAERAVPVLQAEWGLTSATGQPAPPPLPPRPEVRRRLELPAADATWALAECMQGPCKLDGRSYWARLQIEFEPVPGLRKALSLVTRVLGVRRAVLRLQPVPLGTDEFTDLTDTPICCEAELAGVVRLFMPLPLQDHCLTLDYQLSVQAVQGAGPLAPGARIDGRKVYDSDPLRPRISPWRQLSEMDVRIAGQPVGRWALDVGDLADRRDPLVRLLGMSSMPDALADLGAMGLYLLRQQLPALIGAATTTARPRADHLSERWPGPLDDGTVPTVTLDGAEGARLSCYAAGDGGAAGRPPVLLIHGLGSSGSSFTHRSLPCSLALWLRRQGRQVWVLDLRSSIGNEPGRHSAGSRAWTIDSVAQDIPWAVKHIYEASGSQPVDVLAHCMGAVMFCLVALRGDGLRDLAGPGKPRSMVRALVLSQVGPLVRLSPLNRLRGYLAGWLQQYLHLDEVDTCPDFVSSIGPGGAVQWRQRPRTMAARLVDALVATFPYPDPQDNQDDEAQRAGSPGLQGSDFRNIRHRADAIFGQLFELRNLADSTLAALDALLGWVKVPMLAQGIHFARRNMLTDVRGRNAAMRWQNFACRFAFPVLLVHGRRNRLFDWRGSRRSLALLCRLRGQDPTMLARQGIWAQGQQVGSHWGAGTATQLALFDDYGHQDCLIGRQA
ncbi:MAG: GMC family oxidoreductase N-terminal domain-containing protein, partial [Burkholderiales bacterium]|nr:GMC family oxidoreductase N-terminal domain-containing protein [Burkholderiales bacterium]